MLRLSLLGTPQILMDDQPVAGFTIKKAKALLFYLAVNTHAGTSPTPLEYANADLVSHSRDTLATLLWSEMVDAKARQNLRTLLPKLRRLVGDYLHIDRQRIAFDTTSPYWLDVERFRNGVADAQKAPDLAERQALVDLYRGDFLSGFHISNAPAFEAWALEQREQLHTLVVETLFSLVRDYTRAAEFGAALAANRRLLLLEPWSEPVHRLQMDLLARTGKRSAALAQYEACRRILADEFGAAPLAETALLYEQIRTGEWGGQQARATAANFVNLKAHSPEHSSHIDIPGEQGSREGADPEPPSAAAERTAPGERAEELARYNVPLQIDLLGRQAESERLHKWVVQDHCRLVGILGIGGQGKTALAVDLVRQSEDVPETAERGGFAHIIWQSLVNAPPLAEVLQEWMYLLSDPQVPGPPTGLDQQLRRLLDVLRRQRCLLILDNLESILQSGGRSGYYRPGYEGYGQLLRYLAEREHRSCLLFTSREQPQDLIHLEEDTPAVRLLSLSGLPADAGRRMLTESGVPNDSAGLDALVQQYSGNPLALKLAAETVRDIFNGNITSFFEAETVVFDDVRDVLDQQFARLSPLEHELMCWLAIVREPISYLDLRHLLAQPPAAHLILEAVRSLQRRSLLERYEEGFGLQNVVLEYTTEWLIDSIYRELKSGIAPIGSDADPHAGVETAGIETISRSAANRYALLLAQTKEYVRTSQQRLLLQPVAERLVDQFGVYGTEQQLQRLLDRLRTVPLTPGYAAANVLHLLLHLEVETARYDFSGLHLRQLYLREASLPGANFAGAEIVDSTFTEPFGLTFTARFSPDGRYLAAGTSEGDIYLWRTADQQLVQVLQEHNQAIWALSFALRPTLEGTALLLASACDDQTVGLWSLTEEGEISWHIRLSHPQQKALNSVHVGPEGKRVTSVDSNGHVFVWDVHSAGNVPLVRHFASTPTRLGLIAYSGDGRTVAVGNRNGTIQLRQIDTGALELELQATTGEILELALSEDGRMLATGGNEGHLCLWSVPGRQLQDTVKMTETPIDALAFSGDGRMLVTTHGAGDQSVRLWGIDSRLRLQLRQTLRGHTHNIWSASFGPTPVAHGAHVGVTDQHLLVTSSNDQTVRVWDAKTGRSLYRLSGQPRGLVSIATYVPTQVASLSSHRGQPDEWLLAVAGYDGLVYLWEVRGTQPNPTARILRGASRALDTVAISSDGRIIAAAGHDCIVYLWDAESDQPVQKLYGHTSIVESLAFHPDGARLVTSSIDGEVRFWELPRTAGHRTDGAPNFQPSQPVATVQGHPSGVEEVAISPSGHILATVGEDLALRLWDMAQHHYPELVSQRKMVEAAGEQDIYCVAFSPDQRLLACGGSYLIHLWHLHNDDPPQILRQHTAGVFSVAFSPDGAMLASGSMDCTVCVWDVRHGQLRATLHGHTEIVYNVAFSPDGSLVLSCSADGTVRFWDVGTGECVQIVRVDGPYAGMNITDTTGLTQAQRAALRALGAVEMFA